MEPQESTNAGNTDSVDEVGADHVKASQEELSKELKQASWDDLSEKSGLKDIKDMEAKFDDLKDAIKELRREVKRRHIGKEVLTHLIAMTVAVGVERSGSELKELFEKAPRSVVWVEEGSGSIDFIGP